MHTPTAERTPLPLRLAASIAFIGIALLFAMIISFALPAFLQPGQGGPFSWVWRPYQGEFGILPMLVGSLLLSVSALLLAWPVALAICCQLLCISPARLRQVWQAESSVRLKLSALFLSAARACIRFMTAVPTVVYGFAAVFLLTPLVREGLGGSGLCWLSAALMLAILVLPTMILILEAGLAPRLERLCPGGPALGFSRFELLWFFVFPQARKTMLAAALLGFGRAIGDTLLPLMLAGNAPQVPQALDESLRALTAHMALVTANEVGGAAYNSLFAAGALLLLINAVVSLIARHLESRLGNDAS